MARHSVWQGAFGAAESVSRDAADTVRRMQADAKHLRELTQRGKVALALAAKSAEHEIENALGRFMERVETIANRARTGKG